MEKYLNNITYETYLLLVLAVLLAGAKAIVLLPLVYMMSKRPQQSNLKALFYTVLVIIVGYSIGAELAFYENGR